MGEELDPAELALLQLQSIPKDEPPNFFDPVNSIYYDASKENAERICHRYKDLYKCRQLCKEDWGLEFFVRSFGRTEVQGVFFYLAVDNRPMDTIRDASIAIVYRDFIAFVEAKKPLFRRARRKCYARIQAHYKEQLLRSYLGC